MRYFFIFFWMLSFFASYSQDSVVSIRPSTARYYLEVEDRAKILESTDSLSQIALENYQQTVIVKDSMISSYEKSLQYHEVIGVTFLTRIRLQEETSDDLRKKLRLHKALTLLSGILLILVII